MGEGVLGHRVARVVRLDFETTLSVFTPNLSHGADGTTDDELWRGIRKSVGVRLPRRLPVLPACHNP